MTDDEEDITFINEHAELSDELLRVLNRYFKKSKLKKAIDKRICVELSLARILAEGLMSEGTDGERMEELDIFLDSVMCYPGFLTEPQNQKS